MRIPASHLVFVMHCDPSMKARYTDALAAIGIAADVVCVVSDVGPANGLSSRYDALALQAAQLGKGVVLRGLAQRFKPPRALGEYERVILACYSAGYAFARHLDAGSIAMIDALALIDSGHTSLDADHTASDAGVEWAVAWARAARALSKVLVIGHTDVDPVTYASTTLFAAETIRLSGPELVELGVEDLHELGLQRRRRDGLFAVEFWNRRPAAHAQGEHGDALTVWGPDLVQYAASLCPSLPTRGSQDAPPDTDPSPDTRRKPDAAAGLGQAFPHGYRCSVFELIQDAKALGTWRPKGSGYQPMVGDLVVSARAGQEPEHGGSGHVEIVIGTGAKLTTCGGNERNTWTSETYDPKQPDFRGYIERGKLGERAVSVALEEFAAHVHETPGPGATPRISEYHAGARRGGSHVAGMPGHEGEGVQVLGSHASDEVAWCASAASWCLRQASRG